MSAPQQNQSQQNQSQRYDGGESRRPGADKSEAHAGARGVVIDARVPERDVTIQAVARAGRITAVLGPNGAGKSTLLGMVSGTVRAEGTLSVDGKEMLGLPLHRRGITHLAQDPTLFEHMSVMANVTYGPRARGVRRAEARQTAQRMLDAVGLGDLGPRSAGQLSGGQAQRVALARALATDPSLLLLDEPFAALDVTARGHLRALVRKLLAGRTALLVTHDLLDVLSLADDVIILEQGRVVHSGPRDKVLDSPRTEFLAHLVGMSLARGELRDGQVHTDDGLILPCTPDAGVQPGQRVIALVDPSPVRFVEQRDRAEGPLDVTVTTMDRTGTRLLLRCGELAAELPIHGVDVEGLVPGSVVRLEVPAQAVRVYPESDEHSAAQ